MKSRFQLILTCTTLLMAFAAGADSGLSTPWQIGGQPTVAELEAMAERGVKIIVNTRTDEEMAALDFNEREVLEAMGLTYVHIPINRAGAFQSSADVDTLAAALGDGEIFMHCRSGHRASILAAAYLVRDQQASFEDAIEAVGGNISREAIEALLTSEPAATAED